MSENVSQYVHRQLRPAFTVVELLVVIAIIGVMVGMLLPAVGAVRDSARRTQNENNVKQLCTAIMSFEGQHGTYPAMVKPSVEDPEDLTKAVSWAFQILPFIEQEVVHNKYDPKESCFVGTNIVATATPIESLVNPRRRDARSVSPYLTMTSARGAPLDYAGNGGVVVNNKRIPQVLPADPARLGNSTYPFDQAFDPRYSGPFHPRIAVPSAAVRDGLSNTLCIGDRWINPTALGRLVACRVLRAQQQCMTWRVSLATAITRRFVSQTSTTKAGSPCPSASRTRRFSNSEAPKAMTPASASWTATYVGFPTTSICLYSRICRPSTTAM